MHNKCLVPPVWCMFPSVRKKAVQAMLLDHDTDDSEEEDTEGSTDEGSTDDSRFTADTYAPVIVVHACLRAHTSDTWIRSADISATDTSRTRGREGAGREYMGGGSTGGSIGGI